MKHEIDQKVLLAVLNYLAERPWRESDELIKALRQCPEIKEPTDEAKQ